jgi:hypothetical protein
MNRHPKFHAILAIVIGLLGLTGAANARSVVCESLDRGQHYCPADTSGGVSLSVQYSKASCRQGSSWGYDNRGIWVSNGCRARFDLGEYRSSHRSDNDSAAAAALAIGLIGAAAIASKHDRDHGRDRDDRDYYDYRPQDRYNDYGGRDSVTCESRDNRYNFCGANLRHADVDIQRQISRTACRHGQNWGWNSGGIWVNDGCAAVFSIY